MINDVIFFIHTCVIRWPSGAVRDSFAAPVAMVLGLHTLRPEASADLVYRVFV